MPKGPESKLTAKILKRLRMIPTSWWVKIPGSAFLSGIPDILGCREGHFFALEVKSPQTSHGLTKLQALTIDAINEAGGTARMIQSVEDAMEVVCPS